VWFTIGNPRSPADRCDLSSPVIAVDHQACILCDRCIRACDDMRSRASDHIAAANVLTIDELDPHGKIPELKFCAVRLESAQVFTSPDR
jgi:Fe-S-cluster-containing dehydrogenase component